MPHSPQLAIVYRRRFAKTRQIVVSISFLCLCALPLWLSENLTFGIASQVFLDDFNRASLTAGAPTTYTTTTTGTGSDGGASISGSSFLEITNDFSPAANANGITYVSGLTSSFSSPFNPTLSSNLGTVEWTFNFRFNRTTNPAGLAAGSYGVAIVLASTSPTFPTTGNGYAIVYGNTATPDPIRLVRFTGGLSGAGITDIVNSGTSNIAAVNNYVSVRVTYNPTGNNWSLFLRDDGASSWADPSAGVTNQIGSTTSDSTFTSSPMSNFGYYWSYATAATQTSQFDNFRVSLIAPDPAGGTYTWHPPLPGTDSNYSTAINWTPTRTIPNVQDVLIVDGATTPTTHIDNIPSQTISRFRFINGASATLSSGGANTLVIAGDSTVLPDFDIAGASQVTLSGSSMLTISLPSGSTGNVDNLLSFDGSGGSRLIASDVGAVTFPNGTNCTTLSGYVATANPFGTIANGATPGSILFQGGSTYNHNGGASPFGAAGDAQIVDFEAGSTARWFTSSGFQASARNYANLEIGSASAAVSVSDSGAGNFAFYNLAINSTASANSSLTYNGSGSSLITIRGDIVSNGIGAGSAPDVNLTPGSSVSIDKSGIVTFGNDGSNTRSVNLAGNVTVTSGTALVLSRIVQLGIVNPHTNTLTVAGALSGGATGFVVGGLKRTFVAAGSKTFEVGTIARGYSPVDVNATSGTFPAAFTIAPREPKLAAIMGTNALQRYWTLTGTGITANLTFHYRAADVVGSEGSYKIFKYDGSFTEYTPSVTGVNSATDHFATINGVNSFSDWTLGEPMAINAGTLQFVGAPYTNSETNSDHGVTITVSRTGGSDGALDVSYATSAGTATAGTDYTETSGTLHWNSGETGNKTFTVTVKGDNTFEADETVNLTLANATDTVVISPPNPTTLTITNDDVAPTVGSLLISELRTSGPGGPGDDFVELYNNSNSQLTVSASDPSAAFGLFKMGADCNATPVLVGTIPNGTILPPRGHYLFVGSQYSLTAVAAGDATLTQDIQSDANIAIFSTANVNNLATGTRLDAVGFGGNTGGGVCDLLREGNTLLAVNGSNTEHSFFRKLCDFNGAGCTTPGIPKDTNDNASDFMLADTGGNPFGSYQKLGAPGPENLASPIRRDPAVNVVVLDASAASSASPNRVRDVTSDPSNASTYGTLNIRRRVINNTGQPVTRLRFRIVEMTSFPNSGTADLRARSGNAVIVIGVNDPNSCAAAGAPTTPCDISVKGTTLEQPPNQPATAGGSINATLADGTISVGSPLAPGASTLVNFRLGIEATGRFRFLIIVEALP